MASKHIVEFITADGCTKVKEWAGYPGPRISFPIMRAARLTSEDDLMMIPSEVREYELRGTLKTSGGNFLHSYREIVK